MSGQWAGWKTDSALQAIQQRADVGGAKKRQRRTGLHPETQIQIQTVIWFRLKYPQYADFLFASAGGLRTTPMSGKLMKQMGYQAGTPDLFLAVPKGTFHGLFIEVKTDAGRESPAQVQVLRNLQAQGYYAEACYGLDRLMQVVTQYISL